MTERRIVVLALFTFLAVGTVVILVFASQPVSNPTIRSGQDTPTTQAHPSATTNATTPGVLPQPPTEVNAESATAGTTTPARTTPPHTTAPSGAPPAAAPPTAAALTATAPTAAAPTTTAPPTATTTRTTAPTTAPSTAPPTAAPPTPPKEKPIPPGHDKQDNQ